MPMTYRLYESQVEDLRGTIYGPASPDFHPEIASSTLRKALEGGIQTDDDKIISTILEHDNFQRQKIIGAYSDMYKRNLLCDLQEETGGYFYEMVEALFIPAHTYSAMLIYEAITNRNANKAVAVEVICTRTAVQMKVVCEAYLEKYRIAMEKDMEIKVDGTYGRMLRALLKHPRVDNQIEIDLPLANKQVSIIQQQVSGPEEIGRNVELFIELFAGHSWTQIAAFLQRFKAQDQHHRSLQSYVKYDKDLHADIQKMLLVILKIAQNEQLYFAEKLYNAITGADIDHQTIIRICVTRSEIDLADICEIYEKKYKRCLQNDVRQTCAGEYARLLLRLINCNCKINAHETIAEEIDSSLVNNNA
uniref:Annexin n=1 Tax=Syphacia muris TaxID=451379 RepID=A0A0N5AR13_9BILA